jgi:hypothetical protein
LEACKKWAEDQDQASGETTFAHDIRKSINSKSRTGSARSRTSASKTCSTGDSDRISSRSTRASSCSSNRRFGYPRFSLTSGLLDDNCLPPWKM